MVFTCVLRLRTVCAWDKLAKEGFSVISPNRPRINRLEKRWNSLKEKPNGIRNRRNTTHSRLTNQMTLSRTVSVLPSAHNVKTNALSLSRFSRGLQARSQALSCLWRRKSGTFAVQQTVPASGTPLPHDSNIVKHLPFYLLTYSDRSFRSSVAALRSLYSNSFPEWSSSKLFLAVGLFFVLFSLLFYPKLSGLTRAAAGSYYLHRTSGGGKEENSRRRRGDWGGSVGGWGRGNTPPQSRPVHFSSRLHFFLSTIWEPGTGYTAPDPHPHPVPLSCDYPVWMLCIVPSLQPRRERTRKREEERSIKNSRTPARKHSENSGRGEVPSK